MTRPLTLPERAALDRTMAAVIPKLRARRPAPKPRAQLRRHAVAMAIATIFFIGAMTVAAGLNRVF